MDNTCISSLILYGCDRNMARTSDFVVHAIPYSFCCSFCNEQHGYVVHSCAKSVSEFGLANDDTQLQTTIIGIRREHIRW